MCVCVCVSYLSVFSGPCCVLQARDADAVLRDAGARGRGGARGAAGRRGGRGAAARGTAAAAATAAVPSLQTPRHTRTHTRTHTHTHTHQRHRCSQGMATSSQVCQCVCVCVCVRACVCVCQYASHPVCSASVPIGAIGAVPCAPVITCGAVGWPPATCSQTHTYTHTHIHTNAMRYQPYRFLVACVPNQPATCT